MLLIPCPWCGSRGEEEFFNGGDAARRRPSDPPSLGDDEWCNYLYVPANPKGWLLERWWHVSGCGRWFAVRRHTVTHAIETVTAP